tara:strand:- start:24 stop:1259 length:1236 start_codon:yes stop_codon:yes gene_type:complete
MAESQFLITKCLLRPNEGSSLDEDYDIVRGNPIINYFESIESPSISMTITFVDVDQVLGRKGITGGEFINLTIKDGDVDKFKITDDHKMMLNSVRNMTTETNKQYATLEFVSVETIVNETARVTKKFTGNVANIVEELLVSDKKGIQTEKKLEKDQATNSYSFIGNLKRPIDTIQWLCPKAQSSTTNFGFLFYENLDGYHFKSIEKLLKQDPIEYRYTDKPDDFDIGPFKILQNQVNQTNDIGMNCRMGMYANRTIYIDIENQTNQEVDFKITDLDLKKPVKLLDGIEDFPTRLMLRVNDFGVAQVGAAKSDVQPLSELAVYQNKSYIRNNLLFSQSLSIAIPLNTTLRAGFVIDIKLPLKKGDGGDSTNSTGNEKTNDPSGKYLISELRHVLGAGAAETQLTLIRDVFTA